MPPLASFAALAVFAVFAPRTSRSRIALRSGSALFSARPALARVAFRPRNARITRIAFRSGISLRTRITRVAFGTRGSGVSLRATRSRIARVARIAFSASRSRTAGTASGSGRTRTGRIRGITRIAFSPLRTLRARRAISAMVLLRAGMLANANANPADRAALLLRAAFANGDARLDFLEPAFSLRLANATFLLNRRRAIGSRNRALDHEYGRPDFGIHFRTARRRARFFRAFTVQCSYLPSS